MSLKLVCNGEIHKSTKVPSRFEELDDLVKKYYPRNTLEQYALQYEDEDGDFITLSSQNDYQTLLELHQKDNTNMKIFVACLERKSHLVVSTQFRKESEGQYSEVASPSRNANAINSPIKSPLNQGADTLSTNGRTFNFNGSTTSQIQNQKAEVYSAGTPYDQAEDKKSATIPTKEAEKEKAQSTLPKGFLETLLKTHPQLLEELSQLGFTKPKLSEVEEYLPYTQIDENAPVHTILMHEPSLEVIMATLHPAGALYQGVTDVNKALENYNELRTYLKVKGIKTVTVKEGLMRDRESLERLAFDSLKYEKKGTLKDNYYVSDEYKRTVITQLSSQQLVDIVLTQPTYVLSASDKNTYMNIDCVVTKPIGNLIFCRDQQITTRKGIVMGRLNSEQRAIEHEIMKSVHAALGHKIIGEMPKGAYLEGGDFYILKPDLALLGVGLRSNLEAGKYLMENDLLGTDRFALVVDTIDLHQDRIHLDCFFNIVSRTEVVCLDFKTVDPKRDLRRKVMLFRKKEVKGTYGNYHLVEKDTDFEEFLKNEGFRIMKVCHDDQMEYMINFLNIGNNTLIAVNKNLKQALEDFGSKVVVDYIEFEHIKKMYGACHCATQVFRKEI